ncbi:amidohydrolase family protein [Mesorhizobium sp. CO1-1-8]|uniref:amidohydrolase family protein n=1 Tax=Mesorhizobium sp. CO1-1-8 TaxID=2876631 RepID=UPI001CD17FDC|nr:amidohydrolase family protein [Mesorhizobium sp. CO1-1-8]MBZ9772232.1 amidohydrolase family protein [Mesorhizobium sp. CO1-1-8]
MDFWGIEHALLLPASGYSRQRGIDDTKRVNDALATYRDRNPSRFVAAAGVVSPKEGDLGVDETRRCIVDLGMKAMVWHHRFDGSVINHIGMHPILEEMARHEVPAMVHIICDSKLESPWRLEDLAGQHPGVTFIALDAFCSPDHSSWMQLIARRNRNIIFDTGQLTSAGHNLPEFIEAIGADRLIFGTNFYSSEPRVFDVPYPLQEVLALDIPDDQKASILGGRSRELFKISAS